MPTVFGENGGFVAQNNLLFVPCQDPNTMATYIGLIDPTNLNDLVDGSTYFYRAEDIAMLRMPTVRRVGLVYRDLGPATVTVQLRGVDDRNVVITASATVRIGNTIPTLSTLNQFVDIELCAYRPQLSISRAAGGGPISIISTTLWGSVDDTPP